MERIRRREFLRRAGVTAGALAASQVVPRFANPRAAYAQAQATGTLTYGMAGGFDTLDVTTTTFTRVGRIGLHIVDPLVWSTGAGQYAPGLATSWTISPDATVYTFKLREDVKFHDGTPFNAEAVKVTFDRIVDPETRAQTAFSFIGPYDRTEVVDRYTVRVRFKSGHAAFLNGASSPYLGIVSPTAVQRYGRDFGRVVFVGTGPFMLQSYRTDAEVRLIRNPNYNWGARIFKHEGLPYLQNIVYRIVPEEATRLATLETGETLFIEDVPVTDYQRLKSTRDKVLLEIPQGGSGWSLMMNQTRPPMNELPLRRAIMHAIDKDGLVRTVWNSIHRPACSPLTRVMFGFDQETCTKVPYNPDQARRLLEEAGWRTGPDGIRARGNERLRLEFYLQPTPQKNQEMAAFVQANLRQVGIDVNLNVLARAGYLDAVRQGRHHIQYWWDTGTDPGQMLRILFHSRNAGGGTNRNNYRNADMDRLIEQIEATADPARRKELIVRAQQKVIDEAVMVYLTDPPSLYAHDRSVSGVWVDWGGNYPYFYDTRIQR
ncbi:MAG: ABC transporter substrate-binding protein [Armatimonadota bacterium]|nr:ABC transporter substrate-binding protein [Armatimonadota bacterium]MDR7422148.1 ABC transporter substrate-binding protein [Armatimonadota bacterium]MDR7495399.1 ABC transporter substrate-binding protein [Armatimonadota bacterium]MDR7511696.1 ABC transporter substrate-binding protein [Armatimonadota bacterium]